jgi:uncharacterized low-complexity protein
MENKKRNILAGSIFASAIIAASSFSANAAGLFRYDNLDSGTQLRTNLSQLENNSRNFELKCGEKGKTDSTMSKKGKDGKCGEGKCGESKKKGKKKSKDGKSGM